jgi:prevent-host-death family protein
MSAESVSRVGARQLRHELSAILERVWNGESFEITDRGRPVARLVPLPEREDAWDRLIADGAVRPPARPLHPLPKPIKLRKQVMSTDRAIAIERGYEEPDDDVR